MKLAILSDLHPEFGRPWAPPEDLNYDVLVLAGDIDKGPRGIERFAHWPTPVVYVMGNHKRKGRTFLPCCGGFARRVPPAITFSRRVQLNSAGCASSESPPLGSSGASPSLSTGPRWS